MVSALLCGLMILAQPDPVSWDFEDGTLQGWQVVSGNLGPQPTDAKDDRCGGSFGEQGTYFLGTGELPGGGFSDALTGELRSPQFTLGHDALCLLVGAGNHPGCASARLSQVQSPHGTADGR